MLPDTSRRRSFVLGDLMLSKFTFSSTLPEAFAVDFNI
jgi:hypothetical protein